MQSLVPVPTTDKGEEEFGWMMSRVMATIPVCCIVAIDIGEATTVDTLRMSALNVVSCVVVYHFVVMCLYRRSRLSGPFVYAYHRVNIERWALERSTVIKIMSG